MKPPSNNCQRFYSFFVLSYLQLLGYCIHRLEKGSSRENKDRDDETTGGLNTDPCLLPRTQSSSYSQIPSPFSQISTLGYLEAKRATQSKSSKLLPTVPAEKRKNWRLAIHNVA